MDASTCVIYTNGVALPRAFSILFVGTGVLLLVLGNIVTLILGIILCVIAASLALFGRGRVELTPDELRVAAHYRLSVRYENLEAVEGGVVGMPTDWTRFWYYLSPVVKRVLEEGGGPPVTYLHLRSEQIAVGLAPLPHIARLKKVQLIFSDEDERVLFNEVQRRCSSCDIRQRSQDGVSEDRPDEVG